MLRRLLVLVALAGAVATLGAQATEPPTPRQSLQKAEVLFGQGHRFEADELAQLAQDRADLQDSGDADKVAELDLLLAGIQSADASSRAQESNQNHLLEDAQSWKLREAHDRTQGAWKVARNVGLVVFALSTTATLILATVNDRDSATLSNGAPGDNSGRNDFNNRVQIAMFSTAGVAMLSLFPLLWGESHQ